MKFISSPRRTGSTLAVVIIIMAVLMVTVAIAFQYTSTVNRNAQRSDILQNAVAIGDSAIEVLFYNWRATCRGSTTIPNSNAFITIPTPSPFPGLPTANFVKRGTTVDPAADDYNSAYTVSNYKVIAVSAEYTSVPGANATPEPQLGQLSSSITTVTPTTSATYNYIASADVTLSSSFGTTAQMRNVVARVRRVFSKQRLSPWNWAIFYVDPLEIHPGPQFTITGWVHTNSDLYTGHSTLTFADKVTYAGDWYYPTAQHPTYGYMPGDGYHNGGLGAPNWLANLPPSRDQEQQPFGFDTSSVFDTTDTNPNNDNYHELIDPPNTAYSDPFVDEQGNPVRYWDQASIIIQVSDNTSSTAKGWDGGIGPNHDLVNLYVVDHTTGATTQITGSNPSGPNKKAYDDLYSMFAASGAITTNQTIQDNREGGAQVRVASLDVSKLLNGNSYNSGKSSFSTTPVVYMYNSSASGSSRRGIRVKGAATIPSAGLTVASNNPVYVQGDYNTGGTGSTVPSNNPANFNSDGTYVDPSNPPDPNVSGYNRAPCSIVADAVNILSNSWDDTKAGTVPDASPTTINSAIVSGNVPTNVNGDKAYSGGAENFPRFLENWDKQTFTYYGSMIQLYKSQQATGEWGKANVYNPPTREWFFDSNFRTTPPPGTIMIYNYLKGRWSVL